MKHKKKKVVTSKHKQKPKRKRIGPMTTMPEMAQPLPNDKNRVLVRTWHEKGLPATDRAQAVIFEVTAHGLDYVPAIAHLIKDSDEASQVTDVLKTLGEEPLITERYLGPAKISGVGSLACAITGVQYAWVTSRDGVSCLPCSSSEVEVLKVGDLVLISPKVKRIIGRDGDLASCGSVAVVEAIPEDKAGQVIVKNHTDHIQVAWLHHTLLGSPPEVGEQVIYDEDHRFVLSRISTDTSGKELLSVLANLPIVRRHEVGSPHPIAQQVVNHFRDAIERPEWLEALGSRDRKGYLFIGQTGGGKSYHIKLIATEIHDLIEEHTGTRQSRVFLCDASQFWSPYFGETEQRINNWAKKVAKIGSQKLKDKDGKELAVPILGVIEECEALLRARGGDLQASGHLFDRVLSLLLQKLESVENALGVPIVWICSTNRPDLVDAAAMRRLGMRKAVFGSLTAEATEQVMLTKVAHLKGSTNKEKITKEVVHYLHESEEHQALVQVHFHNGSTRVLHRCELVTPAILEEAVSFAVDRCLSDSREVGKLQNVLAAEVVEFLQSHFDHLAKTLTVHNLPEYCPEWFAEDATPIASVKVIR